MSTAGYEGPTISIYKGESKTLRLTVVDENRDPIDLNGATITMTVKQKICDTTALFTKVSTDTDQIEILTPTTDGKADIKIAPSDTTPLDPGEYVHDTWVVLASGRRGPAIKPGVFEVLRSVIVLTP